MTTAELEARISALQARLDTVNQLLVLFESACNAALPCLDDWILTTRWGEVYRRDFHAASKIRLALAALESKRE